MASTPAAGLEQFQLDRDQLPAADSTQEAPAIRVPPTPEESNPVSRIDIPEKKGNTTGFAQKRGSTRMGLAEDDDWFKPKGGTAVKPSGTSSRTGPAVKSPAAVPSKTSSRVAAPAPIPAPAPVGPSAPVPVAKKGSNPKLPAAKSSRIAPAAPAPKEDSRPAAKSSQRMLATTSGPRPSGRMKAAGSNPRMPAIGSNPKLPVAKAPAAMTAEEAIAPPTPEIEAAPAPKTKSSRVMKAASRQVSNTATSSRKSARDKDDDKDRKGKRAAPPNNNMLYIGAGIAAFVVLAAVFAMKGGSDDGPSKKDSVLKDEGDKTPSGTYAKLAEQALSRGERKAAVNYYTKAAERADKEGASSQARSYNMKAMDLIKSSHRNDR